MNLVARVEAAVSPTSLVGQARPQRTRGFAFALALCAAVPAMPGHGASQTRIPESREEIAIGFAPLVREAAPAVVNIYAKVVTERVVSPFADDPFFSDFFRGFGSTRPQIQNSLGSGVILSPDGIVVSNWHVVGTATEIRVVLSDRREFGARVLLADEESDLAILQVESGSGLPHLELRDSDSVEVGELVLAIGNPFGVGQTVTSGIVSGLARSGIRLGRGRGYYLQTDAPINPGNSGGALVDTNGSLIGVNTAILSRSGGSNGIGFAIPSNLVAEFVNQARDGFNEFVRPWAGMAGQPVDGDLAESLGMSRPYGMVVSELHELSPFGEAGIEVGDVISQVDGLDVNSPAEMIFRMSTAGIGNVAEVRYLRDGESLEVRVKMIAPPEYPPSEPRALSDRSALPGMTVARANPALIAEYGLPLATDGVIVVEPGPYGSRVGFRPGDELVSVDGEEVESTLDVARALAGVGNVVRIGALREGRRIEFRFRL